MGILTVTVVLVVLFCGESKCEKLKPRQDFVYPGQQEYFHRPQVQNKQRICQTKCKIYASLVKKKFQFSGLSLDSQAQNLSVNNCDISTGLIVGGVKANKNEFPHMAAIGYRASNELLFLCGASLISERFLLTAAHCQRYNDVSASVVRMGSLQLNISNSRSQPVDFQISSFIRHEEYSTATRRNDIALIKLARNVLFDTPETIRPACLWTRTRIDKDTAVATGWGTTEVGGSVSNDLMKVRLNILDNKVCSESFSDLEIYKSQLCAGILGGDHDTCNGDSGGPLQIVLPESRCVSHIVGITSFGSIYCGLQNSPAVYTRVSDYIDWIEAYVWGQRF